MYVRIPILFSYKATMHESRKIQYVGTLENVFTYLLDLFPLALLFDYRKYRVISVDRVQSSLRVICELIC